MTERRLRLQVGAIVAASGGVFEVVAMRAGEALSGFIFSAEVLAESVRAGLWEGVGVFVDHDYEKPSRSVHDLAGVLFDVRFDGGNVVGSVRAEGPQAEMLAQVAALVMADKGRKGPDARVGLSADLLLSADPEGIVEVIGRVFSVDVVYGPAAGGEFVRQLNQAGEEGTVGEEAKKKVEEPEVKEPKPESTVTIAAGDWDNYRTFQAERRIDQALSEAEAGAEASVLVRETLAGRLDAQPDEIGRVIAAAVKAMGAKHEGETIKGLGHQRTVSGGKEGFERLTYAFERLMGLPAREDWEGSIPRLSGVHEWYQAVSGDSEGLGEFRPERAMFANVTVAVMAGVTANVLNKLMLKSFNIREKWWEPISLKREFATMQDMSLMKLYGFTTLSTVAEGAAYTELTWDDMKETQAFHKVGNYIGITLEMMLKDDTESVRAIPQKLGNAAWNTISDSFSAVFTDAAGVGPDMADATALFDAGRGNLLTTAYSEAQHLVVATAMMKQTEPGSTRKLAMENMPKFILVPVDVWGTAEVVRQTKFSVGDAYNDINLFHQSHKVIVVPPWTDVDNWAAVADPQLSPALVLGSVADMGSDPAIYVADQQVVGSMFTNDTMRMKVRHIYGVGIGDYRGLHKSNV